MTATTLLALWYVLLTCALSLAVRGRNREGFTDQDLVRQDLVRLDLVTVPREPLAAELQAGLPAPDYGLVGSGRYFDSGLTTASWERKLQTVSTPKDSDYDYGTSASKSKSASPSASKSKSASASKSKSASNWEPVGAASVPKVALDAHLAAAAVEWTGDPLAYTASYSVTQGWRDGDRYLVDLAACFHVQGWQVAWCVCE